MLLGGLFQGVRWNADAVIVQGNSPIRVASVYVQANDGADRFVVGM